MVAISRGRERAAQQLRGLVIEMKRTVNDPTARTAAMVGFHSDMVQLAGNQTLILICEMINEVIVRAAVADVLTPKPAGAHCVAAPHGSGVEQIVDLIAAGDDGEVRRRVVCRAYARLRRTRCSASMADSAVRLDSCISGARARVRLKPPGASLDCSRNDALTLKLFERTDRIDPGPTGMSDRKGAYGRR